MPPTWRVVSEIYETQDYAQDYPIVVHIFFGQSEHEAASYYRAHLDTWTPTHFLHIAQVGNCTF
jgi:hypothetical protein